MLEQTILEKVTLQITDGKHGDCKNESNSGYYFISSKDIRNGKIIYEDARQITKADFLETHRRTKLEAGDILITSSGAIIGRMGIAKNQAETPRTTFQKSVAIVKPNQQKVLPIWLYYHLLANTFKLVNLAGGTAQPNLLLRDLRNLKVSVPPIPTQRKIAAILSTYDDLIENNTRRIAILEEMARRLYQEWFVNFCFPGHQSIPLVDSALGPIPQGWEVKSIKGVSDLITRGISPKYDESSESLVINQKCIRNQKLNLAEARRHLTKFTEAKLVQLGDVLINSTGVGTLGRTTQVYDVISDCTVDSHVSIVRPKPSINVDYFGFTLLSLEPHFESLGVGSTGQTELSRDSIGNTEIICPSPEIQNFFSSVVSPIRHEIMVLLKKNANLRATRDLLLPRVISGELDVEHLDISISEMDLD
jgi:type I restriction enzyme S subunit